MQSCCDWVLAQVSAELDLILFEACNFLSCATSSMASAATNGMKLAGMLTLGPIGLVGCIQGAKMYRVIDAQIALVLGLEKVAQ